MSNLSKWAHDHLGLAEVNLLHKTDDELKEVANEALGLFKPIILSAITRIEETSSGFVGRGVDAVKGEIIDIIAAIPDVPPSLLGVAQGYVKNYNLDSVEEIAESDISALLEKVKAQIAGARF